MTNIQTLQALSQRADEGEWHMYGETDVGLAPAPFVGQPLEGTMHPVDLYASENASFICDAVNFTRTMIRDEQTTNDLWLALEAVLVAKGASPAWIAYALPDLHIAAKQYAFSQYSSGHKDAREGIELPNPQPSLADAPETREKLVAALSEAFAISDEEPPTSDTNAAWNKYAADFRQMSDDEIEAEVNSSQNTVDEEENWLEAVASWKAAGKPRSDD